MVLGAPVYGTGGYTGSGLGVCLGKQSIARRILVQVKKCKRVRVQKENLECEKIRLMVHRNGKSVLCD